MFKSFIKASTKVIKKVDRVGAVMKSMDTLAGKDVLIGIPQDHGARKVGDVTNAELAYIHSNGSPLNNIPARPFLQPAMIENKERIAAQQAKIIKDALAGQATLLTADLNRLGLLGQNLAKGWFVDPRNHWAPNTKETIRRKGSDNPLIDTGQLRNAVTYVVREK